MLNSYKQLIPISNIVTMLLVLSFTVGYFGRNITIGMIVITTIFTFFYHKPKIKDIISWQDKYIFIVLATMLISTFNAIKPMVSLKYIVVILLLYICYKTILQIMPYYKRDNFLLFMQIILFFITILLIMERLEVVNLSTFIKRRFELHRIVLSFYAPMIAICFPFMLYQYIVKNNIFSLITLLLLIIAAVFSNGRSGLLGMISSIIIFAFFFRPFSYKRVLICVLTLVAMLIGVYLASKYFYHLRRLGIENGQFNLKTFGTLRIEIWQFAWDNFLQNKWFGIGLQNYRFLDDDLPHFLHPHNFIIQLLLETGIVGTLAIVIIASLIKLEIYKKYFYIWRYKSTNTQYNYILTIIASMCSFTLASLVHTSIFHAYWLGYLILLCAFMKYHLQLLPNKDSF